MRRYGILAGSIVVAAFALGASVFSRAEGGDHAYVGSKKCRPCHLKEHTSWSATKMAKTFDMLKPGAARDAKAKAKLDPEKDYTADPLCLGCHTTGYRKPGGFVDFVTTPDLAGVGCEVCHGPGGTYLQKEHMSLQNRQYKKTELVKAGLVGEITEKLCLECHNARNPFFKEFKFEERVTKGIHERFPMKYKH